MEEQRKVADIMTVNPICCTPDTSLEEVARMMVENDCGSIPVVQDMEDWKPVGIITDRDITCRVVAEGKNPLDMTAEDCMSRGLATTGPGDSVEQCCDLMEKRQVRRILVVDDEGGCCGIVAQADIARNAGECKTGEVVEEVSRQPG